MTSGNKSEIGIRQREYTAIAPSQYQAIDFTAPSFVLDTGRWAQIRGENVEDISSLWTKEPSLVKVLTDPKLGDNALVLLRKELFERMVKVLKDFEAGQAGLRIEMDSVGKHLALVASLAEERAADQKGKDPLAMAVNLASEIFTRTQSKLFAFSRGRKVAPSPLDEEEIRLLAEEDA